MEQNTPMNPQDSQSPMPQKTAGPAGPLVGTIIVIVLLVIGAVYFWVQSSNTKAPDLPFIPGDESSAETWMPASSQSDDAASIQADLEATDMTAFEAQMNADAGAADSGL